MFIDKLICPYCKSSGLEVQDDSLYCKNIFCRRETIIFREKPVPVNFDLSVINRNDFLNFNGESVISRRSNLATKFFKSILIGDSYITKKNFVEISNLIRGIHKPQILVVGGGTIGAGLAGFYEEFKGQIVAFDIYYSDNIDFIADAHNIPLKDNSIDFIIVQAVLEHVINPQKVVAECHRVLQDGGLIYAETPFMQQIHEGAYDFTRFSDSGHRYLFKNFTVIKSGAVAGVGTSLMWAFSYFFSGLFKSRSVGKVFRSFFFWLRYLDRLVSNSYNIDGASCLFFFGQKSKSTITDKELISYYKGAQKS